MITKWPKYRTSIKRTMGLAAVRPYVNKILERGLKDSRGTTEILEDVILHQDKLLVEAVEQLKQYQAITKEGTSSHE